MRTGARLAAFVFALSISLPGVAAPIEFFAVLTGAQESPANASPATGSAQVFIDPVAHLLHVIVNFSGLLAPTTASHIHVFNGPGDSNTADTVGPVATTTPSFIGFPLGVTAGSFDNTFNTLDPTTYRLGWITDSGGTVAAAEAALFAGILEGRSYLNIHTTMFPGGEIRGFLTRAVPEPGSFALLGLALVALTGTRRRMRR